MEIINLTNVIVFIIFLIIGIVYSIQNKYKFIELANFQIDKDTISGFIIMGFVGALAMLTVFLINKHLLLIEIESINNWELSIKQIPKNFSYALIEEVLLRVFVIIGILFLINNKSIALIISSVIFCLLHNPSNMMSVLSYFLAGQMYGLSFLKFKSIWAAIGLHFTWNFFQGAIFGFPVSNHMSNGYFKLRINENWIWNGGEIGPEGSLLGVCIRLVIIGLVIVLTKNCVNKEYPNFLRIKNHNWSK